jgi:hypothetical protein
MERDNFCCQLCGDENSELHVHHKKYNGNPWDAADDDLITYCHVCHHLIEYMIKLNFTIYTFKVFKTDDIIFTSVLAVFMKDGHIVTLLYSYYPEVQKFNGGIPISPVWVNELSILIKRIG